LNNFIHHKSGSNEYKDKQTNITQLTLSTVASQSSWGPFDRFGPIDPNQLK